jgi:hypothetical protein
MTKHAVFIALFLGQALLASSTFAEELVANACKVQTDAIGAAASQITQKYKPQFDQLTQDAGRRAQQIKDESPDPSPVGAVLKFDIKVTTHNQDFIFGLPSATMRTQTIAMDLPVVSSHRVGWSWSVPETTMVQECIPGVPETVCDSGAAPTCDLHGCRGGRLPSCILRAGQQICTKVPSITMVTHDASMDVPDVTMRRQEFKFDLPEFTIVQQRIVITIPDFTVVNITRQTQKVQDDSKELSTQTQTESAAISSKMKTEMKTTMADKIQDLFSCNENALTGQRDKVLLDIDMQIDSFKQKASDARAQKNDAIATVIDNSIKTMIAAKEQVKAEFEKALDDLHKARDQALAANAQG